MQSQHVMVTAGTSRLGRAVLKIFAANGYRVSFTCTPGDAEAKALQTHLRLEYKVEPVCLELNPRDEGSFVKAEPTLSSVDVLINCFEPVRSLGILEADPEESNSFVDRRFYELLVFTRAVGVHMLRRKRGDIVNIGFASSPTSTGDGLQKMVSTGMEGVTQAIRMDLFRSNIRVALLHPDAQGMSEVDIASAIFWTVRRPAWVSVHELTMSTFKAVEK